MGSHWEFERNMLRMKKMQTTIYEYGLHHFLIKLGEFSSCNHIIFFQYFYLFIYLGCGAPSKTVEEWGLFNYYFLVGLWSPWDDGLVSGFLGRVGQRAVGLVSNVLCRSVCCGELSELSGRSGYASPLSLRPLSGAEARLSELLFAAERTNSSACAPLFLSAPVCGIVLGFVIANDFWGLAWDWILFLFFKRKCLRDWTESEQILLRDIQQPHQFRTRIIITKFVSMIWFIPDSVDSYICLCLKFQFF
jgi:hypothetical protein